jgi:hypothetical protein
LERILPQPVLAVAGGLGTGPCLGIVAAEEMKQVSRLQPGGPVGGPLGIDQQRKGDAGFLPKQAGVVQVAQPDRSQRGSGLLKFTLVLAQLRDMLAAEDSAIVPQEDNYGWTPLPQRTEPDLTARSFGQDNIHELRAERFRHTPRLYRIVPG